jgi:hypothetical protein
MDYLDKNDKSQYHIYSKDNLISLNIVLFDGSIKIYSKNDFIVENTFYDSYHELGFENGTEHSLQVNLNNLKAG